jgi:SAM-dependent methyltransferase
MYQDVTAALRAAYDQAADNRNRRASTFDAVYALNSLLHVPKAYLEDALLEIKRALAADGLFFYGVYGGIESDGPWEDDEYVPQRHFAFYLDNQIKKIAGRTFILRDFRAIILPDESQSDLHFQRLILQKESD